jgi:hypothetical protein
MAEFGCGHVVVLGNCRKFILCAPRLQMVYRQT